MEKALFVSLVWMAFLGAFRCSATASGQYDHLDEWADDVQAAGRLRVVPGDLPGLPHAADAQGAVGAGYYPAWPTMKGWQLRRTP